MHCCNLMIGDYDDVMLRWWLNAVLRLVEEKGWVGGQEELSMLLGY